MQNSPITETRADRFPIGELSRRTGVNIETIRYYEKIKILPAPPRTAGGRRIYGMTETRILGFIRRARELGFTLLEIRTLLDLGGPGTASCLDVCTIAKQHLVGIRTKIADLQKLEQFLSDTVSKCSGEAIPECAMLDVLYVSDDKPPETLQERRPAISRARR